MQTIFTIDAHAAGEPCRLIHSGVPALTGRTMSERRRAFQADWDWVRTGLTQEPRGHSGMFGALLTAPVRPQSAYGLIFFDPAGYMDGCGHGTLCSVAVWRRMNGGVHVPFVIDNPDDTVTRVLNVEGDVDHCSIELAMPPALVLADPLDDAETGDLAPALASCGNTFLIVPASSAGVPALREAEAETLKQIALCIHESAPSVTRKRSDGLQILLYEEQPGEPRTFATFVLFNGTQIDRSPCGTGSAALSALLVARGAIAAGEPIRTVGPAGEFFEVEACPRPGDGAPLYDARLRGTAHIIGVHQWIFSAEDRLAQGYLLA